MLEIKDAWATLTQREKQVAVVIVNTGKANKQIAYDLGIVEKTVKTHRGRAMKKLGARNIVEFVRLVDKALAL